MAMVQYGLWGNCCNDCKFCTRKMRLPYSKKKMIESIEYVQSNIDYVDWKDKFSHGISLLGGELFFITDPDIQDAFMSLVDTIIEKILKVSENPQCRFSSVTNGLYDPAFLFRVLDRIKDTVGTRYIDINVSYDLKYRFKNEEDRMKALSLVNLLHDKYDYKVGVQMILTQYVIDMVNSGKFSINDFLNNEIPGNTLTFLYPHKIHSGYKLDDFQFKRKDFLRFIAYLWSENRTVCEQTIYSVFNSESFKWTGFYHKERADDKTQQPELSDGKEISNSKCGHSVIYQCYADSPACIACDLKILELV